MWPVVVRALNYVVGMQSPGGEIPWARTPGRLDVSRRPDHRLQQHAPEPALRAGDRRPDGRAAARLGARRRRAAPRARGAPGGLHPQRPLVDGLVLPGARRRAARRSRPRADRASSGTRSWSPASAPAASATSHGSPAPRRASSPSRCTPSATTTGRGGWLRDMQHSRHDDGGYWTGWQFANQVMWPQERSSWTSAAVLLAVDALSGGPTSELFCGNDLPRGLDAECVCEAGSGGSLQSVR